FGFRYRVLDVSRQPLAFFGRARAGLGGTLEGVGTLGAHHAFGYLRVPRVFSAPGTIRTCDLRLRKPLLYPAELRELMRSATGTERAENSHGAAECASGARGSGGSGPRRARRARGTRKLAPKGGRGGSRSWRRFRPACSFCGVLVLRRA